jgi:hypothetical protein
MAYADNGTEGLAYLVENHPWAMFAISMIPLVIYCIIFYFLWVRRRR